MKKSHGPAFRKEMIQLDQCPACFGNAVIRGVFHHMDCIQCNASGWVIACTGEALPLEVLVTQLNFKLRHLQQQLDSIQRPGKDLSAQYEQNNRRGAGGSNYTGD